MLSNTSTWVSTLHMDNYFTDRLHCENIMPGLQPKLSLFTFGRFFSPILSIRLNTFSKNGYTGKNGMHAKDGFQSLKSLL